MTHFWKFTAVASFSLLIWSFLPQVGYSQTTSVNAREQQQIINHLSALMQTYQVDLTVAETATVRQTCIASTDRLAATQNNLISVKEQYNQLLALIRNSLSFMTDDLRRMQEDSSIINLARVQFNRLDADFLAAVEVYETSLTNLIILEDVCQAQPAVFVAGLHEIESRRRLVHTAGTELLQFIDETLSDALSEVQQRLLILEH